MKLSAIVAANFDIQSDPKFDSLILWKTYNLKRNVCRAFYNIRTSAIHPNVLLTRFVGCNTRQSLKKQSVEYYRTSKNK